MEGWTDGWRVDRRMEGGQTDGAWTDGWRVDRWMEGGQTDGGWIDTVTFIVERSVSRVDFQTLD